MLLPYLNRALPSQKGSGIDIQKKEISHAKICDRSTHHQCLPHPQKACLLMLEQRLIHARCLCANAFVLVTLPLSPITLTGRMPLSLLFLVAVSSLDVLRADNTLYECRTVDYMVVGYGKHDFRS